MDPRFLKVTSKALASTTTSTSYAFVWLSRIVGKLLLVCLGKHPQGIVVADSVRSIGVDRTLVSAL